MEPEGIRIIKMLAAFRNVQENADDYRLVDQACEAIAQLSEVKAFRASVVKKLLADGQAWDKAGGSVMALPEALGGKWVADADMHPATNIFRRRYWAPGVAVGDSVEGRFYGEWPTHDGQKPQGLYWFFPP